MQQARFNSVSSSSGNELKSITLVRPLSAFTFHKNSNLPYFFGYKTGFFSFQNNPKVLDPSCKTDLELWHWALCRKGRVSIIAKFHRTD